ncbi:MAG TPA: hypothetical protein VFT29_14760 [Gemmatimonadaceae bacterium]|nr:hypothetical protein [Gemmatimonadaceae bacterium]
MTSARSGDLVRIGERWLTTGLVVGGVLSIWTAGALSTLVFATGRSDPLNIAIAPAVLMVVGAVAVLPAAFAGSTGGTHSRVLGHRVRDREGLDGEQGHLTSDYLRNKLGI